VNTCGHPVTSLKYVICIGCILAGLKSNSLETCSVSTIRTDVYTRQPCWWTEGKETYACTYMCRDTTHTHIVCLSPTFHASSLLVCCYQAGWSHTLLEPKHGGTTLHLNFINYSQSTGNLHEHHHENLKSHKIILDGCISKYRENHTQFATHFYKVALMAQRT